MPFRVQQTALLQLASAGWFPFTISSSSRHSFSFVNRRSFASPVLQIRGGEQQQDTPEQRYGRISNDEYILTPDQIESFHRDGCITLEHVLTKDEVEPLCCIFDQFVNGDIVVPGQDFCDMSQPFGTPYEDWNLVNCMLPSRYHPPLQNSIYERLTHSVASQLFQQQNQTMVKDYDQLLNKRPNRTAAVFAWHQDMAYWPGVEALNMNVNPTTATCTFSLALDDSDPENGCLRYVVGSGVDKTLRPHRPVHHNRQEGHALMTDVREDELVRFAPAQRGSITIHDEYVVHGSGGNDSPNRQRRTYVLAYRAKEIVEAERYIGFTHSHNDQINWDTFQDGASHRNPPQP